MFRRFVLASLPDKVVEAEGCTFSNGACMVAWGKPHIESLETFQTVGDMLRTHVDTYQTIEWIDPDPLTETA